MLNKLLIKRLNRISVLSIKIFSLICSFIHMRAFPITATGLAEEAIDGEIVVTDSVKDVA